MTALSNFFGQVVFSILLVYAVRELDLSAGTIGIALAIGNLGTLASALTAKRIGDRLGVGRTILLASCLFGPGTLLIAFAPQAVRAPAHRPRHDRDRLRRDPLQRHRDQPDPGDHARPDSRPRQRLAPLRRLGRRAARRLRRRRTRLDDRAARDDGRRRPRRPARRSSRSSSRRSAPSERCRSSSRSSLSPPRSPRRAARQRSSARRGQAAPAAAPARRSPPPTPPSRR